MSAAGGAIQPVRRDGMIRGRSMASYGLAVSSRIRIVKRKNEERHDSDEEPVSHNLLPPLELKSLLGIRAFAPRTSRSCGDGQGVYLSSRLVSRRVLPHLTAMTAAAAAP